MHLFQLVLSLATVVMLGCYDFPPPGWDDTQDVTIQPESDTQADPARMEEEDNVSPVEEESLHNESLPSTPATDTVEDGIENEPSDLPDPDLIIEGTTPCNAGESCILGTVDILVLYDELMRSQILTVDRPAEKSLRLGTRSSGSRTVSISPSATSEIGNSHTTDVMNTEALETDPNTLSELEETPYPPTTPPVTTPSPSTNSEEDQELTDTPTDAVIDTASETNGDTTTTEDNSEIDLCNLTIQIAAFSATKDQSLSTIRKDANPTFATVDCISGDFALVMPSGAYVYALIIDTLAPFWLDFSLPLAGESRRSVRAAQTEGVNTLGLVTLKITDGAQSIPSVFSENDLCAENTCFAVSD